MFWSYAERNAKIKAIYKLSQLLPNPKSKFGATYRYVARFSEVALKSKFIEFGSAHGWSGVWNGPKKYSNFTKKKRVHQVTNIIFLTTMNHFFTIEAFQV